MTDAAEDRAFDWIWSDQHFGHTRVVELSGRPFRDAREMTDAMIDAYLSAVRPGDVVLWLGDVSFLPAAETAAILARLPGRKVLVRGNHDRGHSAMARLGFDLVTDQIVATIGDRTVRMSHYPYWNGSPPSRPDQRYKDRRPLRIKGEVLLHGHTHQPLRRYQNQVHVGVDAWGFRPVSYDEIAAEVGAI